jgi:hypothetical protein
MPAWSVRELIISATDEAGEPWLGLGPDDFAVFEDGAEREIVEVRAEERFPIHLGVLIHYSREDLSLLSGQLQIIRWLFLSEKLRVGDGVFLEVFGPEFASVGYRELAIDGPGRFGEILALYAEAKYLPEFLQDACDGSGGTTLSDAVEHACTMLRARPASQGALIVIADVALNIGAVVRKSSVPIYGVSLAEAREDSQAMSGCTLPARNKEGVRERLSRIFRDLRSGYRVRYLAAAGCNRIEVLARGSASLRVAGGHGAVV